MHHFYHHLIHASPPITPVGVIDPVIGLIDSIDQRHLQNIILDPNKGGNAYLEYAAVLRLLLSGWLEKREYNTEENAKMKKIISYKQGLSFSSSEANNCFIIH